MINPSEIAVRETMITNLYEQYKTTKKDKFLLEYAQQCAILADTLEKEKLTHYDIKNYYSKAINAQFKYFSKRQTWKDNLFKFIKIENKNQINSILTKIKLSQPNSLNDHFDCPITHLKNNPILLNAIQGLKISSFINNKNAYNNILMWSYYASHTGICIHYDFSKFNNEQFIFCKINYNEKYKGIFDIINSGILQKSNYYKHENEVRMFSVNTEKEPCEFLPNTNIYISSIYFGIKCDKDDIKTIKNILKEEQHIEYYQMTVDSENPFEIIETKL